MKYELRQSGKLIGTYDSIDLAESKIADLIKVTEDYSKHDSHFSENDRKGNEATHLIHVKIFKTNGEITTTSFLLTSKEK